MPSNSFASNSGTQVGDNSGTININNHLPPDPGLLDLPCVPEAIFNHSKHEDQNQLQYCHDGTRQELLQTIYTWVGNLEEKAFFLLSGWPGTGKTTIARTVAKKYRDQNVSFMFQKGNGDCGLFGKFVTTVASQLVAKSPRIKKSVHDALCSDPSILDQGIEEQWNRLVLEPLEHLPDPVIPYVLVIDALDECVNGKWLLDKLLQKRPSGLRILITSRPHLLRPNLNDSRYHHVVLHDLEPDIVSRDILLFFQMALEKRRPGWPDQNSLKLLVCRANGIFEWAALASRFLNESDGVYESRLQRLLGDGESHLPQEEMSSLYLTILSEYVSLQNWEMDVQSTCCSLLRHYLGSLVVLFDQLPPRSLYRLIPREAGGPDIHEILGNLGSILDFPSDEDDCIDKIRIHHPTFRDFLLDRERCTDSKFYVEKKEAHKIVLGGCLDLLLNTLKRDICQTEDLMVLEHDAGQSHTRQVLPEVQYACLYWAVHLIESGENVHGNDTISRFLFDHSLHWLEVLGWMGRSLDALSALERLSSLAKCDENSEIYKFIEDLTFFARHNRNLIDENPHQLYISGLIFAPAGSLVRQVYANEALRTVQHLPKTRPQWPYCFLQSLEDHNGDVQALAFSDRRTILASASSDFTIRLWNTLTGETLQIIEGFQYPITAVSFSKEGKEHFLASLSDRVVQIWDVRTGYCIYTLPNPQGYKAMTWINDKPSLRVISYDCVVEYWSPGSQSSQRHVGSKEWVEHGTFLIFSGDTMTFATWSDVDPIHIWHVTGDFCSEKVALDHIGESRLVSLSYDGALVATVEKRIRIYDTNTGKKLFSLEGDLMYIRALAFAPNSRLLASGSNDRTVRLWSLTTKQCLQKLEGHRLPVISLEFSDTSDILASGSQDATVHLWDVSTIPEHERQENPQEDLNRVTTLAVAEDGQTIAVGFSNSCIHLYHIQNEKGPTILQVHEDQISDLYFLENGETLASASFDGTIQLWDTVSGQHLKTFVQYPAAIQALVFTDDHKMLASILLDFTISTWTVQTGALPILVGHTSYVESAVFLQPDEILASSSRDKTIRIWDIVNGICLRTLNGHEHWVNGLAFSQDGNTLASASPDNTVRLWDSSSGHCLRVIPHGYGVESVTFSRDQRILASISGQGIISIWDISQSPKLKKTLIGPPCQNLGLTSTGQYLITDRGSLALDMDPQNWKPWEQPRSVIYVDREWILNGTQRVLWIPRSYRNSKLLMVRDKTVVLWAILARPWFSAFGEFSRLFCEVSCENFLKRVLLPIGVPNIWGLLWRERGKRQLLGWILLGTSLPIHLMLVWTLLISYK